MMTTDQALKEARRSALKYAIRADLSKIPTQQKAFRRLQTDAERDEIFLKQISARRSGDYETTFFEEEKSNDET